MDWPKLKHKLEIAAIALNMLLTVCILYGGLIGEPLSWFVYIVYALSMLGMWWDNEVFHRLLDKWRE